MRTILLCLYLAGLGLPAKSQIIHYPLPGASPAWLAPSGLENDPFQLKHNPSLLPATHRYALAVASMRLFGLPDAYVFEAAAVGPFRGGAAGWEIGHAGWQGFAETRISLAYGKKLGAVDLGISFGYFQLRYEGYGSAGTLLTGLGFSWKLNESVRLGAALFNPAGGYIGREKKEKVPVGSFLSLSFHLSEVMELTLAARAEEGRSLDLQPALQYRPARELLFDAGFHSAGLTSWIRAGWQRESWQLRLLLAFHPRLGASPGLQLIFVLPEKN